MDMDMGAGMPPEQLYNIVADAATGAPYFISASLTRCPAAPDVLEEAVLDITITDGAGVWTGEGLNELSLGAVIPNRMRHTLEALAALQPSHDRYSVRFQPQEGSEPGQPQPLLVEVEWDNRRHGKDLVSRTHFFLEAAPDEAGALHSLMAGMLQGCEALSAENASLEAECDQLESAAAADHAKLDVFAAAKQAGDEDAALKAAALLVSKEEKLQELQAELQAELDGSGGGERKNDYMPRRNRASE